VSKYLLNTGDKPQNGVQFIIYLFTHMLSELWCIELVKADVIMRKNNILFYFTGLVKVRAINDNIYLPGALANYLILTRGAVFAGRQMSVPVSIEARGGKGTSGAVLSLAILFKSFQILR